MADDREFPTFDTFNDARSHLLAVLPQVQHLPTLSMHASSWAPESEIYFDSATATSYRIRSGGPASEESFVIDTLPGKELLSGLDNEITSAVVYFNDPMAYLDDADIDEANRTFRFHRDRATDLATIDEANAVELACMRVDNERRKEEYDADPGPFSDGSSDYDPIANIEFQLRIRIEETRAEMTRLAMARAMHMRNLLSEYPNQHGAKAALARRLRIPAQSVHDALSADARRRVDPNQQP
ncbi:hypothetical protein ACQP10_38410 (plasmid) [Streptosporangium sandarakinum]|uniref:hypothetical protein n=1 Tax=Streptosporangium sandarakinum TaxID=1260955 RepID=UPI003D93EE0B